MSFSPGDLVVLASGSPELTVLEMVALGARLIWYEPLQGSMQTVVIPAFALKPARKSGKART